MGVFYNSSNSPLLEEGIANLHCWSARYLTKGFGWNFSILAYSNNF